MSQQKQGRPWIDDSKIVPELHTGGWEHDVRVCVGTTNVVEIDKFYGPLVAQPVRVSIEGEAWVVERMVEDRPDDPQPGTSPWVECARFPLDGGIRVDGPASIYRCESCRATFEHPESEGDCDSVDGKCAHLMTAGWRPVWVKVSTEAPAGEQNRHIFSRGGWVCPQCVA